MTTSESPLLIPVPADDVADWLRILVFARKQLPRYVRNNGGALAFPASFDNALRELAQGDTPAAVPTPTAKRSNPSGWSREYNARTAAEVLGVSSRLVRTWCSRGSLRSVLREGNGGLQYVLDADQVDAIAAERARQPGRTADVPVLGPAAGPLDDGGGQVHQPLRPEVAAAVQRYGDRLPPLEEANEPRALDALLAFAVGSGLIRSMQDPLVIRPDGVLTEATPDLFEEYHDAENC